MWLHQSEAKVSRSNMSQKNHGSEPWFGTMYTEIDMPAKWIKLQRTAEPFPEFSLPEPNPFITDNFTILIGDGDSEPFNLFENEFCGLWHRKNNQMSRPYAEITFTFTKHHAVTSIDK